MGLVSAVSAADRSSSAWLRQLSSGFRVNSAADDPAGMVRASKLRSEMAGLSAASRNAASATDFAAAVDSNLSEVSGILARLNELAVSAASSGGTEEQVEVGQLLAQLDAVGKVTFGGRAMFSSTSVSFQVGASSADVVSFTTYALSSASLTDGTGAAVSLASIDVSSNAAAAMSNISDAMAEVASLRAALGARGSRAGFAQSLSESQGAAASDAYDTIMNVDVASAMEGYTRASLRGQYAAVALARDLSRQQSLFNMLM